MKIFRDGAWHKNWLRLYNVQCWYSPNACEIFQIKAHSKESALDFAHNIAKEKGYYNKYYNCQFEI